MFPGNHWLRASKRSPWGPRRCSPDRAGCWAGPAHGRSPKPRNWTSDRIFSCWGSKFHVLAGSHRGNEPKLKAFLFQPRSSASMIVGGRASITLWDPLNGGVHFDFQFKPTNKKVLHLKQAGLWLPVHPFNQSTNRALKKQSSTNHTSNCGGEPNMTTKLSKHAV